MAGDDEGVVEEVGVFPAPADVEVPVIPGVPDVEAEMVFPGPVYASPILFNCSRKNLVNVCVQSIYK